MGSAKPVTNHLPMIFVPRQLFGSQSESSRYCFVSRRKRRDEMRDIEEEEEEEESLYVSIDRGANCFS